jgi:hypothetical protein
LEILKTAFPSLVRMGVLTNPQNVGVPSTTRAMDSMAQALNVQVQYLGVRSTDELDATLAVAKARSNGVVLSDEQVISVGDSPRRIADFALSNRLPSIGPIDGAKSLRARVRRVEQPATERDVTWPAHVRVDIRRGPGQR